MAPDGSGSCSCGRRPAPTGRICSGCSISTATGTASERSPPIRAPCWAGPTEELSRRGAGAARAQPGGLGGDRRLRHGQGGRVGRVRAVGAAVHRGAARRDGARTARPGPVIDPRPSPDGRHIAYVAGGALRVRGRRRASGDRALAEPEDEHDVTYGLAEFIAAEEMGRLARLLVVAGVGPAAGRPGGRRAVRRWWIADPAHPDREPAAGRLPGGRDTQRRGAAASRRPRRVRARRWPGTGRATRIWRGCTGRPRARRCCSCRPRDQRSQLYLAVDTGERGDPDGARRRGPGLAGSFPRRARLGAGRAARADRRRGRARGCSAVGDRPLTGPQLHVRAVLDIGESDVLVSASAGEEAAGPGDRRGAMSTGSTSWASSASREEPACTRRCARARVTCWPPPRSDQPARTRAGAAGRQAGRDCRLVRRAAGAHRRACGSPRRAHGGSRAPCCCPRATGRRTVRCRC